MRNLRIDGDRLWASVEEMAKIGATPKGGVCRLALTDFDKQARDLFVKWCVAAGCQVSIDRMGNIFARREGTNPNLAPVATGSHLDSQPTGGRFDGAYGVLAGLEIIRTLNDFNYQTIAPIEVVVWTNEEGSRFAPAMVSSGVFAGAFDLDYGHSRADSQGTTLGEELARIGYAGETEVGDHAFGAFFEAHIEQGPILEQEGSTIGVVTGAQGQRWYELTLEGQDAHTGPTPMSVRRDALVGAAQIVTEVHRVGHAHGPHGRATVGLLTVTPNSRNTIPGRVFLTVDLRHPSDDVLTSMDRELRLLSERICSDQGLDLSLDQIWYSRPVAFDSLCIGAVRAAANSLGIPNMEIVSGAGHDACYINRVAPTGMIFIPCAEGISHNELESATPADVAAGAQVLLRCMLDRSVDGLEAR
jgi:beta-ureidopropionase / N-carbamoyl-L-amino-acid hydrolase